MSGIDQTIILPHHVLAGHDRQDIRHACPRCNSAGPSIFCPHCAGTGLVTEAELDRWQRQAFDGWRG